MSVDRMLKGHEVFKSLSVDEVHRLSNFSSVRSFESSETIYEFQKPSSHLYMLMEGDVYLQLPASPREFSFKISKVVQGELFGISSMLIAQRYPNTAQCYSSVKVLSIEAKPFLEMLRKNGTASTEVMTRVADIYFHRYMGVLRKLQDVISQITQE